MNEQLKLTIILTRHNQIISSVGDSTMRERIYKHTHTHDIYHFQK